MADNTTNIPTQEEIERLREQLSLITETNEQQRIGAEILEATLGKQSEYLTKIEKEYHIALETAAAHKASADALQAALDVDVESIANAEKRLEAEANRAALMEKHNLENITGEENIKAALKGRITALRGVQEEATGIVKRNKESVDVAEQTDALMKQQMQSMFGLKEGAGSMTEHFVDALGDGEKMNEVFEKMGNSIRETFTVKSWAKVGVRKFQGMMAASKQAAFGFDGLLARWQRMDEELIQSTGAMQKYGDETKKMVGVMRDQNFTMAESGRIYETLFTQSQAFSDLQAAGRQEMIIHSGNLTRLGVSADTFAASLDGLNKVFGASPTKVKKVTADLSNFGRALGIGPNKMLEHFNKNLKLMVYYGEKQGVAMLKKLAATAKKTGIEMSALVAITEKFDTFEGAAESAGQLNMLLGGPYLNSVQLLKANEAERIELIRESVRMSGKQFDQMDKFHKQAIAQAMGTDVDVAQKLFSDKNIKSIKDATAAIEAQGSALGTTSEQAKKALTPQQIRAANEEKMLETMTALGPMMEKINNSISELTGYMNMAAPIMTGITMIIQGMTFATTALGGAFTFAGQSGARAWLMLLGPIAAVIAILYVLIKYWDDIGPMFMAIAESVVNAVKFVVKGIFAAIIGFIGGILWIIAGAIDLIIGAVTTFASLLPGIDIEGPNLRGKVWAMTQSAMPEFAEGVDNRHIPEGVSKTALVGEKGPELRVVDEGNSVITNKNLETIATMVSAFKSAMANNRQASTPAVQAQNYTPATQTQTPIGGTELVAPLNITLELDGAVLDKRSAKITVDVVNRMMDIG